jgi:hypothetical protein
MCFDDRDTYTTRTYIANGARYSEEYDQPRYGMSWRRKNGLGGSYYPSRYYSCQPSGRYRSSALMHQNRYSSYAGYPPRHDYTQHGYSNYHSYPRGLITGGYPGYSSGYNRCFPDARVAMPSHIALVSLRSFPFSSVASTSCLPIAHRLLHPHWLV